MTAEGLYVVVVDERVDERIAGRRGCVYASPPQSSDAALELVGLLLGAAAQPANGGGRWTRPVPGGQRTITLAPAADGG